MLRETVEVRVGDVWRDLDPRGGPTFRVVEVDSPMKFNRRAVVTDLAGKRMRRVLLNRFRHSDGYRSGYTLVTRLPTEEPTDDGEAL